MVLLAALAWWLAGRARGGSGGAGAAEPVARPVVPQPRVAAAAGVPERGADPANLMRMPGVGDEVVRLARKNQLSGADIDLENEADARAFAELTRAPPEAVEEVARCQLDFVKVSDEPCSAEFVGVFRADGDEGKSQLVALRDATTLEEGPEEMGQFDPTIEHGQEACRRYRRCVARAVLGKGFTSPRSMAGADAWSSTVSPDMHLLGEDFMKYRVGDDLARALDQVLAHYEDANPWYLEGDDFDSLLEAGNAACADKYSDLGDEGGGIAAVCRSNVGSFAMDYLIRRAMRRMLEP